MIYLDTNVVIWLAAGELKMISQTAQDVINSASDVCISPLVLLELKYLLEVKRITKKPEAILAHLDRYLGFRVWFLALCGVGLILESQRYPVGTD